MKNTLVLFHSVPDYSGNARALYEYAKANCPGYDCLWLVDRSHTTEWLSAQGVKCLFRHSFPGLVALLRAEAVVLTHGGNTTRPWWKIFGYVFRMLLGQQPVPTVLYLGHGRGPKGTGNTNRDESEWRRRNLIPDVGKRYFISKSLLVSYLIAVSDAIHPSRIFITGEPRNDWLLTDDGRANLEKILGLRIEGRRVILWVPTFRDNAKASGRQGGIPLPDHIRAVVDSAELVRFLKERDAIFVLKLHPYEEHFADSLRNLVRPPLYILDSRDFQRANLDLYQILGGVDLLITDYSSVYIDFLLLDRPVVFYLPDLAHYREIRGFKLEPLEFWMPGPRVSTMEELVTRLDMCLSDPSKYRQERRLVASLMHRYKDARSAERVWNELEALLTGRGRSS